MSASMAKVSSDASFMGGRSSGCTGAGERRGRFSGTQCALDGRRQAGSSPVAGEKQVRPAGTARRTPGILRRRRRKGRPFLLHDTARRRRVAETVDRGDVPPQQRGQGDRKSVV